MDFSRFNIMGVALSTRTTVYRAQTTYEISSLFVSCFAGVTVQRPEVTSCNLTAPIATFGALRNPREVLLRPNRTQIFARRSCQENALANNFLFRAVVRTK